MQPALAESDISKTADRDRRAILERIRAFSRSNAMAVFRVKSILNRIFLLKTVQWDGSRKTSLPFFAHLHFIPKLSEEIS